MSTKDNSRGHNEMSGFLELWILALAGVIAVIAIGGILFLRSSPIHPEAPVPNVQAEYPAEPAPAPVAKVIPPKSAPPAAPVQKKTPPPAAAPVPVRPPIETPRDDLQDGQESAQTAVSPAALIRQKLGSRTYAIPAVFFGQSVPAREQVKRIMLETSTPDFKPRSGTLDPIEVLVKIPTAKDNIAYLSQFFRKFLGVSKTKDMAAGLAHYVPTDPESTRDEMFTEEQASQVISFITCDRGAAEQPLRCAQYFESEGLLYVISYDKSYLKDWAKLRTAAPDFIKTFAIEAKAKSVP